MNNSDILVALTLWLATFIYLFQVDPGLLKIKVRKGERSLFIIIWVVIIALVNHEIFERAHLTLHWSIGKIFLTPNEWALIIFLWLFILICHRVFSERIFNYNSKKILEAVQQYRTGKKYDRLVKLLEMMMKMTNFGERFGEQLDDIVFNDHHLIEEFCSESPDLVIKFTDLYPGASINNGYYFYYILNGLFGDQGNAIYSEIRRYRREEAKSPFLVNWDYGVEEAKLAVGEQYRTKEPIIRWLSEILGFPPHLQQDVKYFLENIARFSVLDNEQEYSGDQIETVLSRDPIYNAIQLFRILLIELSLSREGLHEIIDRYVIMLYSSWYFVVERTELKRDNVQLNNDSYTINEYLLKYIFEGYCSLFILNCKIMLALTDEVTAAWVIQQLVKHLNRLWAGDKVSMETKEFYMQQLIELYYELPEYISADKVPHAGFTILYQLKNNSLDNTPFGNIEINRMIFDNICKRYEFYRQNNKPGNELRANEFYEYFLPYSEKWKYKIVDF